jgi:hypothetical protein
MLMSRLSKCISTWGAVPGRKFNFISPYLNDIQIHSDHTSILIQVYNLPILSQIQIIYQDSISDGKKKYVRVYFKYVHQ